MRHGSRPGAPIVIGLLAGFILHLLGGGCAQIEPPSGGPEDKTPPTVVSTYPESLATGVGIHDSLVISFSEPMNKGSVKDWLFLSPEVERLQYSWEGWDVTIRPRDPLKPDRTYVFLLATDVKDRRRNSLAAPILIPFSTGDHLDTGLISGRVIAGRLPAHGHFVFAWPGAPIVQDTLLFPPGGISDAYRRGQTDTKGEFVLSHLPINTPLTIGVIYDADGNRSFDQKADFWACYPEPVSLIDTLIERTGFEIYLVYPDEPGLINGTVYDSLCIKRMDPVRIRIRSDSLHALIAPPDSFGVDDSLRMGETDSQPADEARQEFADRGVWEEWEQWAADTSGLSPDSLDTVAIDSMLTRLSLDLETALEDSLYCSRPIWVELFPLPDLLSDSLPDSLPDLSSDSLPDSLPNFLPDSLPDSLAVSSVRVSDDFELKDVAPGSYWLRAYRDLDLSGDLTRGEPASVWMGPYEIKPVRTIDSLAVSLPALPKPWPEEFFPHNVEDSIDESIEDSED